MTQDVWADNVRIAWLANRNNAALQTTKLNSNRVELTLVILDIIATPVVIHLQHEPGSTAR